MCGVCALRCMKVYLLWFRYMWGGGGGGGEGLCIKCTCGGYRGYVHECVTVVVQEHVWVKPGYVP